ncbi:hypothetical protein CIB48_g1169 [Xylaria polymorpha]|nr:hypothetical protein CIB48_g1169 [Xylaria polymorpha]
MPSGPLPHCEVVDRLVAGQWKDEDRTRIRSQLAVSSATGIGFLIDLLSSRRQTALQKLCKSHHRVLVTRSQAVGFTRRFESDWTAVPTRNTAVSCARQLEPTVVAASDIQIPTYASHDIICGMTISAATTHPVDRTHWTRADRNHSARHRSRHREAEGRRLSHGNWTTPDRLDDASGASMLSQHHHHHYHHHHREQALRRVQGSPAHANPPLEFTGLGSWQTDRQTNTMGSLQQTH